MNDSHKDKILFHLGFFIGSMCKEYDYTFKEVYSVAKEYFDNNKYFE